MDAFFIYFLFLNSPDGTLCQIGQCGRVGSRLLLQSTLKIHFFRVLFSFISLAGLPQLIPQKVWHFRARRKLFPERFGVSALGESYFPNGFAFPRMAKVVSRKVWLFRAWRKSFPEWFGISALGESHFLKGLEFPRLAKVISRMVWSFRGWRKSFPEWFGVSALGESRFPNGLMFPRMSKVVSRIVLCLRTSRKSVLKGFDTTRYKAKINQQKNF